MNKYIVITSIQSVGEVVSKYASLPGWTLVLVGDVKGPNRVDDRRIVFLDIEAQARLGLTYEPLCPKNHYSRKNIGYLYAMRAGADIIGESDDDNMPYDHWGSDFTFDRHELPTVTGTKHHNVYKRFTNAHVWPRGFPLDQVLAPDSSVLESKTGKVGVWQDLVDGDLDVDAIYRLTSGRPVTLEKGPRLALDRGVYCAFNSQNTFWSHPAFLLLYLPISVSFRYTDILRSFVAQRLLWEMDLRLGFGPSSVLQDRNAHNLMHDFRDEVPMYESVNQVVAALDALVLTGGPGDWLLQAYKRLLELGIVEARELASVRAWTRDFGGATNVNLSQHGISHAL